MNNRIPFLDGIRGLAVLVVILGHLRNMGAVVEPARWVAPFFNADFGVNIFFVLSGFLITSLLRAEPRANRARELRHFYLRRFFKLWPALAVFVVATAIADRFTGPGCTPGAIAAALTFTTDIVYNGFTPAGCAKLAHTWSLSIEEVFYLLWAPFAFFVGRRSLAFALSLLLIGLAIPMETLHWAAGVSKYADLTAAYPSIHVLARIGAIATGALLSELLAWEPVARREVSAARLALLPAGLFVALVVIHASRLDNARPWLVIPFRFTVESLFAASLILACVRAPWGLLARAFSWAPLRGAGLISYSLYLWQQVFTHYTATFDFIYPWQRFPLNVALMFLAGYASFRFVESPIQAWAKARWRGGKADGLATDPIRRAA